MFELETNIMLDSIFKNIDFSMPHVTFTMIEHWSKSLNMFKLCIKDQTLSKMFQSE